MTRKHRPIPPFSILCLSGLLAMTFGCGAEERGVSDPPVPVAGEPGPDETESTPDAAEAADDGESYETTISGFRFTMPAGWREVPLRPGQAGFIDASYEIPEAGEDVELTFTTSGGGVQANVDRWVGQFTLPVGAAPDIETFAVDGIDVTWVKLEGTFDRNAGRPFGDGSPPDEDWMMIGVIYDRQPQGFFLKLTGPAGAIAGLEADFRALVESARVR